MGRGLRILILLAVLFAVLFISIGERYWVRTWSHPLHVAIYPIALDAQSQEFVSQLSLEDFQEISGYLRAEAARWGNKAMPDPLLELKAPLQALPPTGHATTAWEAIRLSLGLRWYAFRNTPFWQGLGTIRLFLLYHQPIPGQALPHSLGLQKGLLGVVHVFAEPDQQAQNNVIITHELMHALGASDKYDAQGMPSFPLGYADPYADPVLPQHQAEIMAGRIPRSETRAVIPENLGQTLVGSATAAEIGW